METTTPAEAGTVGHANVGFVRGSCVFDVVTQPLMALMALHHRKAIR